MPYLLNILYVAIAIVISPLWLWRMIGRRFDIGGIWLRLRGVVPAPEPDQPVTWLHGSSVGELLSLRPLIDRLQEQDESLQLAISAYTKDGWLIARETWPDALVFYLPFDFSWSVRRAWSTLNPRLLVLSELELWPNLLLEARRQNIPVAVVSSRMNDDEIATYRRINWFHRFSLQAIHWWGAQTQQDADRIRSLNGTSDCVVDVTGSLKPDVSLPPSLEQDAAQLRRQLGFSEQDQILVAGSTHDPEERLLLEAFDQLRSSFPQLRLVIVPRHPRRAHQIRTNARDMKIACVCSSELPESPQQAASVTVMQSIGRLSTVWALADIGFVGGSLTPDRGGQNMIEPALLEKPVCFGPHVRNFQQVADGLLQAGGAKTVQSPAEIVDVVRFWLQNPNAATDAGTAGRTYIDSCQGAAEQTARALRQLV